MSFCKDCFKGVIHEGIAKGKWEVIGGVNCYVATPTVDYPKDTVIFILPDLFGVQLINTQLIADSLADNGLRVVGPDFLNGDPAPEGILTGQATLSIQEWFANHGPAQTRPPLDKVITALKAQGVRKFGASGHCFGARYVFDLAFDGEIQAAVVSHPSLLKIPDDLEKWKTTSVPLLINSCTTDQQFPAESQAVADAILGGGKFAPGYKREYFEGCTHGFSIRGDLSDPKVKAGKEGAFKATVEWFIKYL